MLACDRGYYCPNEGQSEVDMAHLCVQGWVQKLWDKLIWLLYELKFIFFTAKMSLLKRTNSQVSLSVRYYCDSGAQTSQQHDCTVGHYCEVGAGEPSACPPGTYSNAKNLEAIEDCTPCTEGMMF